MITMSFFVAAICSSSSSLNDSLDGPAAQGRQLPATGRHWVVAVDETEDSIAACQWMLKVLHHQGRY
jgi:hypothetical protein